jgi:hypothetical protein
MRLATVALLLAVSTPALADGLVVSKKVTTLETTDKAFTKIKLLTLVPDVLACFRVPVEVDVDLEFDGKTIAVTTDQSDAARAKCLEGAFARMKVKTVFKSRVHLVAKEDPRKKQSDIHYQSLDEVPSSGPGVGDSIGSRGAPKPPQNQVAVGAPNGSLGGYTTAEIQQVMKAHSGTLRACYQRTLAKRPKLSGKWTYEIQIGTDGKVTRVKLKASTTKSTDLDVCLQRQLKKVKFPAKGSTAVVTYPLLFQTQN